MSRAADVYSFSMIMWELFACKRLYEGHIASQVSTQGHAQRRGPLLSMALLVNNFEWLQSLCDCISKGNLPATRHNLSNCCTKGTSS